MAKAAVTKGAGPRATLVPAVLCLEGEWDDTKSSDLTIEHAFRLLEANGYLKLTHRNVNTINELRFHVDRMVRRHKLQFDMLYLGFHGDKNGLAIGEEDLGLNELAHLLQSNAKGQIVYLASCSALTAKPEALMDFCKKTGARALVGYTRDVDWVDASAFEVLAVSQLLRVANMKPLHSKIMKEHPVLARMLGFRMAHSKWVSELPV